MFWLFHAAHAVCKFDCLMMHPIEANPQKLSFLPMPQIVQPLAFIPEIAGASDGIFAARKKLR